MNEMTVFIYQFAAVYLLGIQSLMVNDRNCWGAASGSMFIGMSQFYIFSTIGGMSPDDAFSLRWWCFILAGPCAIVTSIKTHPFIQKLFKRHGNGKA